MTLIKEHDPEYTVWGTVATLEKKRYTRTEIADTLEDVAEQVRP